VDKLAAIDLGSNSFHLLDAVNHKGALIFGQRIKNKVQLGAGLDIDRNLSQSAINRGLDCLQDFQKYIVEHDIQRVEVVGTNTLRIALNGNDFIVPAEDILGASIRVISGKEEAQLIFNGVIHEQDSEEPGLVIDVGGGSTEFAVGDKLGTSFAESINMGCLSYYQRFFADGKIYSENVRAAEMAARLEIEPHLHRLSTIKKNWAVGCSGTMQSIAYLTQQYCGDPPNKLYRSSIDTLGKRLILTGHVKDIKSCHLDSNRRAILPAGLAIVRATFELLELEEIRICHTALCEGVLQNLSADQ